MIPRVGEVMALRKCKQSLFRLMDLFPSNGRTFFEANQPASHAIRSLQSGRGLPGHSRGQVHGVVLENLNLSIAGIPLDASGEGGGDSQTQGGPRTLAIKDRIHLLQILIDFLEQFEQHRKRDSMACSPAFFMALQWVFPGMPT